jgi:hypothetical protein
VRVKWNQPGLNLGMEIPTMMLASSSIPESNQDPVRLPLEIATLRDPQFVKRVIRDNLNLITKAPVLNQDWKPLNIWSPNKPVQFPFQDLQL